MFDKVSGVWSVYTADISDRAAHKLKTNIQELEFPYWSHDGKWIYFLGYGEIGHQLYRCPAEGGNATLLTGSMDLTAAIDSFDGKLLYFPGKFGDANMMMIAPDRAAGSSANAQDLQPSPVGSGG
jgi:Tol biopolymer transport system component